MNLLSLEVLFTPSIKECIIPSIFNMEFTSSNTKGDV
jgi:hypothetical protein